MGNHQFNIRPESGAGSSKVKVSKQLVNYTQNFTSDYSMLILVG